MNVEQSKVDAEYLKKIIEQRCGMGEYLSRMHMTKKHFERLIGGAAEFRQNEMLQTAAVLSLDNSEFSRCFFSE